MAQKHSKVATGPARRFPPEAYNYSDDVKPEAIAKLRAEIGIDYSTDEWEVVDEFGHLISA